MISEAVDYVDIFLGPVGLCPGLGFVWKHKRLSFGGGVEDPNRI